MRNPYVNHNLDREPVWPGGRLFAANFIVWFLIIISYLYLYIECVNWPFTTFSILMPMDSLVQMVAEGFITEPDVIEAVERYQAGFLYWLTVNKWPQTFAMGVGMLLAAVIFDAHGMTRANLEDSLSSICHKGVRLKCSRR